MGIKFLPTIRTDSHGGYLNGPGQGKPPKIQWAPGD